MAISPQAENLIKCSLTGGGAIGAYIGAPLLEMVSEHTSTVEDVVLFICGGMAGFSIGVVGIFLANRNNKLYKDRDYK